MDITYLNDLGSDLETIDRTKKALGFTTAIASITGHGDNDHTAQGTCR